MNIFFPAVLQTFMMTLLEFATFDLIDTEPIYNYMFGVDNSEPLNDNFDYSGYSSLLFERNIGSLGIFIFIGIGLGVSGLIMVKIKKLP